MWFLHSSNIVTIKLSPCGGLKLDIQEKLQTKVDVVAGPLKNNSYLILDKMVKIYEA